MPTSLRISEVRFTPAPVADSAGGLVGFVTCVLNGALRIDGLALRLTSEGRLTLVYPARRTSRGARRSIVRPISNTVREDIERAVFAALGLAGEETP